MFGGYIKGVFAQEALIDIKDPGRFTSLGLHLYSNFRDLSNTSSSSATLGENASQVVHAWQDLLPLRRFARSQR